MNHDFDPQTTPVLIVPYVWIGDFTNDETAEPDTDLDAVMHGAIAVTPLHLDLTHDPSLALLRDLFP